MIKNPTPQQIAFLLSLIVSISTAIILWLLLRQEDVTNKWLTVSLGVSLVFFTTFFSSVYLLKRYIYRKIKVIYKTIHDQKLKPVEKNNLVDLKSNVIDDVEREVEAWAEDQARELEKYKSWAEYRRKFVGDISHELKTPIFNIQGYVHTLLDGGLDDREVNVTFLNKAAKNVERLQTIVDDLEAISRLESGELILEMQNFDIKALTIEVFEELEFKAGKRDIQLNFKEGAAQGYKVKADRESIRQVLINLVNNSIKYGVNNGQTKVGFYDMDKNILVEVADNGIGISKRHLNHVFDRFYRADKSRSRAQGGSGLGLSIVKHILEAHQQTINVRSTPDMGSTFGFTLEKS